MPGKAVGVSIDSCMQTGKFRVWIWTSAKLFEAQLEQLTASHLNFRLEMMVEDFKQSGAVEYPIM